MTKSGDTLTGASTLIRAERRERGADTGTFPRFVRNVTKWVEKLLLQEGNWAECPPCPECDRYPFRCTFEYSRTQNTPFETPPGSNFQSGQEFVPTPAWENGLFYESTTASISLVVDPSECVCNETEPCCVGEIAVYLTLRLEGKTGGAGAGHFCIVPDTDVSDDQIAERSGDGISMEAGEIDASEADDARELTDPDPPDPPDPPLDAQVTIGTTIPCEDGTYARRFVILPKNIVEDLQDDQNARVTPGDPQRAGRPAFIDLRFTVEDCGCEVEIADVFLINFSTRQEEVEYFEALLDEGGAIERALDESVPPVDVGDLPGADGVYRDVFRLVDVHGPCNGRTTGQPFPEYDDDKENADSGRDWDTFVDQLEDVLDGNGDADGGNGDDDSGHDDNG